MCLQWNVNLTNINFWLVTALDQSNEVIPEGVDENGHPRYIKCFGH